MIVLFTIINGGGFYSPPFTAVGLAMLTDLGLRKHPKTLLQSWMIIAAVVIPINLALIYIFPQGIRTVDFNRWGWWILGYYSANGLPVLLPMVLLYSTVMHKKLTFWNLVLAICILWTGFAGGSQTMTVTVALMSIYIVFFYNRSLPKIFNYNVYIIFLLAFFIAILFFNIQERFEWLIVDILGRRLDFTYRTQLWSLSIEKIVQNPLIGIGTGQLDLNPLQITFGTTVLQTSDPHNFFLTIFYTGGLVAFISLMTILFLLSKPLMKYKTHPIASLLAFSIFAFLLFSLTWTLGIFTYLVPLFVIAANLDAIINLYDKQDEFCKHAHSQKYKDIIV